jgi:hypothetical protein
VTLAERIAAALFTNGAGERAERLQMLGAGNSDLGGWCEAAVAGVIQSHLDKPTAVWMKLSVMALRIGRRVNSLSRTIERNDGQAPGLEIQRRLPAKAGKRGKIVRVRASEEFFEWLQVTGKDMKPERLIDVQAGNLFAIGTRRARR